jgi:hypothetical protein
VDAREFGQHVREKDAGKVLGQAEADLALQFGLLEPVHRFVLQRKDAPCIA